jgi:ribonuclease HI
MSNTKILHFNTNRNSITTENVLQEAIKLNISILAIQEPWVIETTSINTYRSINHTSFIQVFPNCTVRPRVMYYILKTYKTSLALISPKDPDCIIIDLIDLKIQLINIYNATHPNILNSIPTIQRKGLLPAKLADNTVIVGDFNTHHPWWDPRRPQSPNSLYLLDFIKLYSLNLVNTPGEGTFYRPNMAFPSVIDLSLVTKSILNRVQDWQILPDLGSDHYGVLFTIYNRQNTSNTSNTSRFNTRKANWKLFKELLQSSKTIKNLQFNSNQNLDLLAETFTNSIIEAATTSIPKSSNNPYSKPWWNDRLTSLRKTYSYFCRKAKESNYILYKDKLLAAKNIYFNSVKIDKTKHWNQFLEKEDSQSIFKAFAYTKDYNTQVIPSIYNTSTNSLESTFQNKCNTFKTTLFPQPPTSRPINLNRYKASPNWTWPKLAKIELREACNFKIKGKTPGPDLITQEIITQAYIAIPEIFYKVYSLLINKGYHPKVWKQATGFILKKPKKPDYSRPKAYRVISLLNCLGKVSERILARRLSYLAETTSLLHYSQIGSRLRKSAIDTTLLLQNQVEVNKANKLKTSTLFLDVKGAFDHVSKNRLIAILVTLKLPLSLIYWISSFLEDRIIRLSFNNQIEAFSPINTGIPQGSPISPILFLIYIRDLFKSDLIYPLSYMDDIALTASSKSFKRNIKILEREAKKLVLLGKEYSIEFDIDKTELIHFFISPKLKPSLLLPNGSIIQPSRLVRWLGIHFDSNLKFKEHIAIRTSLAKQAFYRLNRLSNITKGLTPFALRQLYIACVISVSDYGSILWWNKPNKTQVKPLQAIQNLAIRKILGVFKTAPILPMELESGLLPPIVRLNYNRRRYAFRILKLSNNHPIKTLFNNYTSNTTSLVIDTSSDSEVENRSNPNLNQIERLIGSISNLVDLNSLEPIKHFYFAPWQRELPYNVRISLESKDKEAKLHVQYLKSIRNSKTKTIYTDGSQTQSGKGIGLGFATFDYNTTYIPTIPTYEYYSNIGNSTIVYNSELEGVTRALEYAISIVKRGEKLIVYTDNQAGLLRLKTPSDWPGQNQQIRAIKATKAIIALGAKVELVWVPGHSDILGNEIADKLAKLATTIRSNQVEQTSFAYLGIQINKLKNQDIHNILKTQKQSQYQDSYTNTYTWKISKKICLPLGIKRELASSFFQLKLGHGYIKSYLYRLKLVSNNKCKCGQKETAKHLFLNCSLYIGQRKALLKRIKEKLAVRVLTLPLLLHTKIGIENTLVFLKETSICTRIWHLQRVEEEEEPD